MGGGRVGGPGGGRGGRGGELIRTTEEKASYSEPRTDENNILKNPRNLKSTTWQISVYTMLA
jgi:hypothetical protein